MISRAPLTGLYAITSATVCADGTRLLACAEAALRGGARLLQYRDKDSPVELRRRQAGILVGLCHHFGAALIVNDDVDMARAIGADGVHLGAGDGPIAVARATLGPDAIIGASCGTSLERAAAAVDAGASYVAFGRFFPSRTKPDAPQAQVDLLPQARTRFKVDVCAIGGITAANGRDLLTAGADLLAAVDGVFGSGEPVKVEAAAREYAQLFAR